MKNSDLLRTEPELNPFTRALAEKCGPGGRVMVKMRNGTWVKVGFMAEDEEDSVSAGFMVAENSLRWKLDGSSYTSRDFDLIECEDI